MNHLIKTAFLLILLTGIRTGANAAEVDTVKIFSNSMNRELKAVVIRPDAYSSGSEKFPVVYLLHGHSGAFDNWIKRVPDLHKLADQHQVIIVCPEGNYAGWYVNSPIKKDMQFESHVSTEVPAFIDQHYRTINDRSGRAITGLSMGGHGAMLIGYKHAARFGACGSMSGALNLEGIRGGAGIMDLLGDTLQQVDRYKANNVTRLVENYPADSIATIIDCGVDDFLFEANRQLHLKMVDLKIPHDYIERPGKHDWDYWRNAIAYQFLFFRKYFDQAQAKK